MRDVVRYLAALAPEPGARGTVQVRRKQDLILLRRPDVRPRSHQDAAIAANAFNQSVTGRDTMFPLEFHHDDREVERFAKIDALSPEESLLRLGFIWLAGRVPTAEGAASFLMPVVYAEVKAHGYVRGMNELELLSDFEIAPELGSSDQRDLIEDEALQLAIDILVTKHPRSDERLAKFAILLANGFGLPIAAPFDAHIHPFAVREEEALQISGGLALYLARDVDQITFRSTLTGWADADLSDTAFAAIYGGENAAPTDPESTSIESPVLLNGPQRGALLQARSRQVSVISGPPGTGKTHTVAALALDEVALGRSVLVATQSDHAAEVITEHLRRIHTRGFVRFGSTQDRSSAADQLGAGIAKPSRREMRRLARSYDEARHGYEVLSEYIGTQLDLEATAVASLLHRHRYPLADETAPDLVGRKLEPIESIVERHGEERTWWSRLAMRRLRTSLGASPNTPLEYLQRAISVERAERSVVQALAGRVELEPQWVELAARAATMRRRYAAVIDAEVRTHAGGARREAVDTLAHAMRAGRRERRKILRESDLAVALEVLPLWIGTLGEIDDTLPAIPGLFDVVVFDEASQIEQLRSATALMRARRAVVAGDPRQLRHVSFVSDERMDQSAEAAGITAETRRIADVRRNSLFDVAAAATPVVVLKEHFRSIPHIIEFSNRMFYNNTLRLMTQHPRNEAEDAIETVFVGGVRDADGVNRAEVAKVLELLGGVRGSVGVVAPLRAQAEAIAEAVLEEFTAEQISEGRLKIGTAHAMQGSEHETVIVSLAIDGKSLGRRRFLEDPNLFNTMVTRAKNRQILLVSFDGAALGGGLLLDYLKHADHPSVPEWDLELPEGWVGTLGAALRDRGLRVVPDYAVAGWNVDLAVGTGSGAVGVICRVHPAGAATHIERQSALRRAGWELIDAFESLYLAQPEAAVRHIVHSVIARMEHAHSADSG